MRKKKNIQVAKISVFITSVFVIFLSISYAFLTSIITSNKLIGINSGILDLVLEEGNEITLTNAYPMYDEVGMIQEDSYDFKIVNKTNNDTNYILKLKSVYPDSMKKLCSDLGEITTSSPNDCRKVEYPEELRKETLEFYEYEILYSTADIAKKDYTEEDVIKYLHKYNQCINCETFEDVIDFEVEAGHIDDTRILVETYPDNYYFPKLLSFWDVRYYLTKNGEGNEPKYLGDIQDNILDSGTIKGNETIDYSLRLWINSYVSRNEDIEGKVLSFKVEVEVSQEMEKISATSTSQLVDNATIGNFCKTYDDGVDTFLVGQCENNYLWYSGKLWRVVSKNNETGNVKLVTDDNITAIEAYSNYNSYNFENGYLDQWLNQEFLPTLNTDYLVTDSKWYTDNNLEERPSLDNFVIRTVGLLNPYEYNTTYSKSNSIANNTTGYLNNNTGWWLLGSETGGKVGQNGNIYYDYNSYAKMASSLEALGVRPSVIIKNNLKISGGFGSKSNPYILDDDTDNIVNGSTLLSTRYSGEYIKFNNELYRIINIEDNLTKIRAVNPPKGYENIKFDESNGNEINFSNSTIKTKLENYYQDLKTSNNTAYNMIEPNTTWYLGQYGEHINYKECVCSTVDINVSMRDCSEKALSTTATIGLPRIGEMFTADYPNHDYWTLTNYNNRDDMLFTISQWGASSTYATSWFGYEVLPVMYLKSSVKISSNNEGNGTYENPYELELN